MHRSVSGAVAPAGDRRSPARPLAAAGPAGRLLRAPGRDLELNAVFFGPVVERTELPEGVRPRQ